MAGVANEGHGFIPGEAGQLGDVRPKDLWLGELGVVVAGAKFPPELSLVLAVACCLFEGREVGGDRGKVVANAFPRRLLVNASAETASCPAARHQDYPPVGV